MLINLHIDRFFEGLQKAPAFSFADGPALGDFDEVAQAAFVSLVVHADLCPASDVLAVLRMLDFVVKGNLDGFIAALADYDTG